MSFTARRSKRQHGLPDSATYVLSIAILAAVVQPAKLAAQKIYFISNRGGSYELYVMNADGGEQTKLTEDLSSPDIQMSPDGSQFLVVSDRDGASSIYTVKAGAAG